jgi:hypothetical protein
MASQRSDIAQDGESLLTVLDRVLDSGVVIDGTLVLSVAGVDLVFVGLRAMLASIDTASRMALAPRHRLPALPEVA